MTPDRLSLISKSDLNLSMVTIYVGLNKTPFHLRKERLCQHSSFFQKAFDGGFAEASNKSMTMEEDGVEEFKMLEEQLYTGRITTSHYDPSSDDMPLRFVLVKLFCLAEKVGIIQVQNKAL